MTPEPGAQERARLDGPAGELYREIVEAGGLPTDDPRLAPGHPLRPELDLLLDLGLLGQDPHAGGYLPVDPSTVQARVIAPMGRQAAELLQQSTAWADTFGALRQAYRRTPAPSPIVEISGLENINRFLEAAVDDAQTELLTAQPSGARSSAVLEQAAHRDIRALQRGVEMRTLYQHSSRRSRATSEHVHVCLEHGAQVRTLDEFFHRLIVIDRRLAVIPGHQPDLAVAVYDAHLVGYLADIFDRIWERGHPYEERSNTSQSDVATEVRQLTVRMLTEGYSDPTGAKRMGVSTRTYATYVAALKEEFGAETRFQLGYAMGLREATGGGPGGPENPQDDAGR